MKKLFTFLIIISTIRLVAQAPANNNCTNATNLTIDAPLLCAQSLAFSNVQASECSLSWGAGTTTGSVWYSFTASQTQLIFNYITTNSPGCFPAFSVYGPFPALLQDVQPPEFLVLLVVESLIIIGHSITIIKVVKPPTIYIQMAIRAIICF